MSNIEVLQAKENGLLYLLNSSSHSARLAWRDLLVDDPSGRVSTFGLKDVDIYRALRARMDEGVKYLHYGELPLRNLMKVADAESIRKTSAFLQIFAAYSQFDDSMDDVQRKMLASFKNEMNKLAEKYIPRVLVIDDYKATRTLCTDCLSRDGLVKIEAFETCDEALEKMRDEKKKGIAPPDMVLTNAVNSGGEYDGIRLTKQIRTEFAEFENDINIFVMSSDSVEKEAREAGATDYLRKPFNLSDLDSLVERLQPSY